MDFWEDISRYSISKGKTGFRVFTFTHGIFEKDLSKQFVNYESNLDKTFKIPLTAICAYPRKDVNKLSLKQIEELRKHHLHTIEYDKSPKSEV